MKRMGRGWNREKSEAREVNSFIHSVITFKESPGFFWCLDFWLITFGFRCLGCCPLELTFGLSSSTTLAVGRFFTACLGDFRRGWSGRSGRSSWSGNSEERLGWIRPEFGSWFLGKHWRNYGIWMVCCLHQSCQEAGQKRNFHLQVKTDANLFCLFNARCCFSYLNVVTIITYIGACTSFSLKTKTTVLWFGIKRAIFNAPARLCVYS